MSLRAFAASLILLVSYTAKASSEGLSSNTLANYPIAGLSRPCCTFGIDVLGAVVGVSGVVDKTNLGSHSFARDNGVKDSVGLLYTCSAGFVDVSHLRDNADWSAHVYFNLRSWLGSGKTIFARNEGGFKSRAVYFPQIDQAELSTLNDDDLEKLAVSIGFNLALLHEIPTAFKISVSVPAATIVYERSSAFSVEDAFSNLLGNILGAQAARSPLPYNEAMTLLLKSHLDQIQAQSVENTYKAYELTRNDWWVRSFLTSSTKVLRREFSFQGQVEGQLIPNAPFCANTESTKLTVPLLLSNGKSVNDYYEIRGLMNNKLKRNLRRLGLAPKEYLTQSEYPEVIEAIKNLLLSNLGESILKE